MELYDNSESKAVIAEFGLLASLVVLFLVFGLPLLLTGASEIRRSCA